MLRALTVGSALGSARSLRTFATMHSAVERMVQLPTGLSIATKTWGDSNADASKRILALHGYLDNTNTFDLLGPALADEGYRFVAMDFQGHGKSSHASPDSWYNMLDYPGE
jgi:alpha-beta hydrolase superfamily lysophospholipase